MGSSQEPATVQIETFHQNVPGLVGRCVADEVSSRVHDNGYVLWLARAAGFLVSQALDSGPLSADSGQT